MSCIYRVSSLFCWALAIAFGMASSASASIIVANGKTYSNTVRVVATVQVSPTQDAGVTVVDPYHVTLTNPAANRSHAGSVLGQRGWGRSLFGT
jgi:hypothetical protein